VKALAVDLHVHSNVSDGVHSPRELVFMARARGLTAMALTDHDSVRGVPSALVAGEELGVFVIPGVELSTDIEDAEIHILGFYIDMASARLHEVLDMLKFRRRERCSQILDRLRTLGMDIPLEYVLGLGQEGFTGRSHIFKAMVNLGFAQPDKRRGDFQRYLGKNGLAYVEHGGLSPEDAVRFVRDCSGVPVLAHPGTGIRLSVIESLINVGLEGIEAYHPTHSKETTGKWLKFAESRGLIVTGGSDFHKTTPDEPYGLGSLAIPDHIALDLTKRWLEISPV
jgi:predicted metal-dependent phosphoesterase TrpH